MPRTKHVAPETEAPLDEAHAPAAEPAPLETLAGAETPDAGALPTATPDLAEAPVTVRAEVLVGLLHYDGRFHAKGDRIALPLELAQRLAAKQHVRY
jgi:hypothetical protein